MRVINLFTQKDRRKTAGSPGSHQPVHIGKKLYLLAFISVCFLCFVPLSKQTTAVQSKQTQQLAVSIDPEDMVQNGIYFFADHGNGMSVAQFDRMEGNNIYTSSSIKPLQLLFSGPGLWGTVSDAGNIRLATLTETIQLLLSILAGEYVPYP